jgi:serine/threonine-protein kinase HipA
VYKAGVLPGHLNRTGRGCVVFTYMPDYLAATTQPG